MFEPISLAPAVISLAFALLTVRVLAGRFGTSPDTGRFVSIDGLRGYLAFFVFLHHSCIWYFFLKTGHWKTPPSNVYANFGQGSVALFFMITGFLFFTKIINERGTGIDWLRLYVSRALRLVPLYLFAMLLLFLVVAVLSHAELVEAPVQLIKNSIKWLGFTILDTPDLNDVRNTSLIVAGVTWSLAYEWLFYASLPLLALFVGNIPAIPFLTLALLGITGFVTKYSELWHLLPFAGGIAAALLVRFEWFREFASKRITSLLLTTSLVLAFGLFPTSEAIVPFLLLTLSFALIAGGNTLFGALSSRVSLTLGEMAYSIYLLHGLMLFVLFNFLLGKEEAALLSAPMHWLLIISIAPVLVTICFLTYRFIERPAMRCTTTVTTWIRPALRRPRDATVKKTI